VLVIVLMKLQGLFEFLNFRSTGYLDEMVYFLWDDYEVMVSEPTVQRVLARNKWSRKQVHVALVTQVPLFSRFHFIS
jgi:hypothetical protein